MKSRFAFVLLMVYLVTSCTKGDEIINSEMFWREVVDSMQIKSREEIKNYFTDDGWKGFSKNFVSDEQYEHFSNTISGLQITEFSKLNEDTVKLFIGENDRIKGRISVVIVKIDSVYKITEYRARK